MTEKEAPKEKEVRAAFREQAAFCRGLGSEITATALETAAEKLSADTRTGKRILNWDGDPTATADNVPLRLTGGLHAIARSGTDEQLAAAYRGEGGVATAVETALAEHDAELLPWLDNAPQTNEAGRAAIIMAGLLVAANRYPMPIELLELGSSGGLVLNLEHYRYDLGGVAAGDPDSSLLLKPEWKGSPPPNADVQIAARRGVDLNPLDLSDPVIGERLAAYVWPDQQERLALAEKAIAIAQENPPPIDKADAASWTEEHLSELQSESRMRILFHTIAFQYFPVAQQQRIREAVAKAGAAATEEQPFGWLAFELNDETKACELRLTLYPGGEERHLANGHPHVTIISWKL